MLGQERRGGDTGKAGTNPAPAQGPTAALSAGEHSPNRLIVKFRAEGEHRLTPSAYRLMKERAAPEAAAAEPGTVKSLLELGRKSGLKKMQHLFFGERVADPSNASVFQRKLEELLRTKFPARDRRAPGTKLPDLSGYFVLEFDGTQKIQDVKRRYEKSPLVEAAHLDPITRTRQEPNDPFLHSRGSWGQKEDDLWGLKRIGCLKAWETSKGRGIVVAVVDTGLEYNHPDIAANVWANPGEVAGNKKDDDGNGFVDDVRGWDFINDDNDPLDDSREGHGTHVAGIITAVGNNGIGIIGVAPEAKIMPVKAVGAAGSVEFSTAAKGFFYAVANGADVINCSWGPGPSYIIPLAIEDLVRFAHGLGVVVVFAAGNDSRPAAQQSPMNMKEVLTVGASVPSDARMPRSNWGRYLSLLAPGGSLDQPPPAAEPRRSILSLKAESFSNTDAAQQLVVGQRYVRLSGTSMAAPHVAGVAALVLAVRPDLTNDDVMQILRSSAQDDSVPGFDLQSGYGRLDAAGAVALAKHKPPTVLLTNPAENAELPRGGGRVTIRGVVGGDRLKQYQLFYSRLDRLTELTPLTQPAARAGGRDLAVWDTSSVPQGCYLIRLVATDTDGNRFEDLVQVYKAPPGVRLGRKRHEHRPRHLPQSSCASSTATALLALVAQKPFG
jgi:subtilisin family serine protease